MLENLNLSEIFRKKRKNLKKMKKITRFYLDLGLIFVFCRHKYFFSDSLFLKKLKKGSKCPYDKNYTEIRTKERGKAPVN